jgi:hypothetical protein
LPVTGRWQRKLDTGNRRLLLTPLCKIFAINQPLQFIFAVEALEIEY